ncbi:MAG: sigma 54-interacting transcriptional regulator [Bradymonadia bacterium]
MISLRVLLIDDDPHDARILKWHLSRVEGMSCTLDLYHDPYEGLEVLCSNTHDICLLDFRLGPTDGLEMLTAAMARGCQVPVVMLTASTEEAIDIRALDAGATDYLEKQALDSRRLARVLRYTHERARAAQALKDSEARLAEAYARLEGNHEDLQALFNRLSVGCALADQTGRLTFMSEAAAHLFETSSEVLLGVPLGNLPGIAPQMLMQIVEASQQPAAVRERLSLEVKGVRGGLYQVDLDVVDDPRDPSRRMLFFYDVTEVKALRRQLEDRHEFHALIGRSAVMTELFQLIRDVARFDITVLIEGETGTGKELVAHAIHAASPRKDKPFIPVNCAGLTDSLLASQLFGHRRGAFTGAIEDHEGLFEAAEGGTLFLDEIGDIPPKVQTNLLRVLQEREITRLGETRPRPVNVRVIAATHRDLSQEVEAGRFRADLLYRIRIMQLQLPPLRERRDDVPLLANSFLEAFGARAAIPVPPLTQRTIARLLEHHWPGNVRELKAAMEHAMIRSRGRPIEPQHLPPELEQEHLHGQSRTPEGEVERILEAIRRAGGNRTQAARMLGISRATFYRRLEALNIDI